eukprot:SAG22_NODE_6503_length_846_cov_0.995984_2_plen_31_part_01
MHNFFRGGFPAGMGFDDDDGAGDDTADAAAA